MPATTNAVRQRRIRRHRSVRKRIQGTPDRPRLNIFRSSAHIYAQIIDDERGHTLVAASTMEGGEASKRAKKSERARALGERIAERAKEKGVERVVFDRGGYLYHGRVKAVAEGARAGGLEF